MSIEGRSEAARQSLGIDGTMGDAQDVRHAFVADPEVPYCLVCGLSAVARIHPPPPAPPATENER